MPAGLALVVSIGCSPPGAPMSPVPVQPPPSDLRLGSPFEGERRVVNYFDHDLPLQFEDDNKVQVTFWGESTVGIDGHSGYDWDLPVGTPLLAMADGKVTKVGFDAPFFCPLTDKVVTDQKSLRIRHKGSDGSVYDAVYKHLDGFDVVADQVVRPGQVVGTSGGTGCVTGPHLHLELWRLTDTPRGLPVRVDPYGWRGEDPDPWAEHPLGVASTWMWAEGQEPPLYREVHREANATEGEEFPVAITTLRWMGLDDRAKPGNEFVELKVDPRYAPGGAVDIGGYSVLNMDGDRYVFPRGFVLRAGNPVRIVSGHGRDTDSVLYWGRSAGAWDNFGDKARLFDSDGRLVYELW